MTCLKNDADGSRRLPGAGFVLLFTVRMAHTHITIRVSTLPSGPVTMAQWVAVPAVGGVAGNMIFAGVLTPFAIDVSGVGDVLVAH